MITDGKETFFASHSGRIISGDIPVVKEAHKVLASRVEGRTILVGELFAAVKKSRPRAGDLGTVLGGGKDADVNRIGFQVFDLVLGGDKIQPAWTEKYPYRLKVLQRLLKGGKRVQLIRTEVGNTKQVNNFFEEWVKSGKAEGLVIRSEDARIYKLKPFFTLDAAVIGFTECADYENQARSLLLCLLREDGQFQLVGSVGIGDEERRQEIYKQLQPTIVESQFQFASKMGALYRFVEPKMVVEVRLADLQVEDASCKTITKIVLDFDKEQGWRPLHPLPGVSLIHPVLVRVRDDKQVTVEDISTAQVLSRCQLEALDKHAEAVEVPPSMVKRREVYTKAAKGKQTIRKLVVWKTNKEEIDDNWPAYVVYFTDYSPNRKDQLKREVRLAPSEEVAMEIADGLIVKNIKRGWVKQ